MESNLKEQFLTDIFYNSIYVYICIYNGRFANAEAILGRAPPAILGLRLHVFPTK